MRALILLLPAIAAGEDASPGAGQLRAEVEPAVVVLEPSTETQPYLQLPELEFGLTIEPRCEPGTAVRSVLVSVADTRLWHDGRELDDNAALRTVLSLPRQQAGRLRVGDFCRRGSNAADSRRTVRDAFTAHLSLRCGGDGRDSVTYITLPLDVILECRADAEEARPAQSPWRF